MPSRGATAAHKFRAALSSRIVQAIPESASGVWEVSLSLAERNRTWQRRLQFSLLRVSLPLLTLIAVSAIVILGNFQNWDSRNRGFSRMRQTSADYSWTIRGARENPRLRIYEGQ